MSRLGNFIRVVAIPIGNQCRECFNDFSVYQRTIGMDIYISAIAIISCLGVRFLDQDRVPDNECSHRGTICVVVGLTRFACFGQVSMMLVTSRRGGLLTNHSKGTVKGIVNRVDVLCKEKRVVRDGKITMFVGELPRVMERLPISVSCSFRLGPIWLRDGFVWLVFDGENDA